MYHNIKLLRGMEKLINKLAKETTNNEQMEITKLKTMHL